MMFVILIVLNFYQLLIWFSILIVLLFYEFVVCCSWLFHGLFYAVILVDVLVIVGIGVFFFFLQKLVVHCKQATEGDLRKSCS